MKGFPRTSPSGIWSSTNCFPSISLHPRFAFNPSYPGAGPPPPQPLGLQNNGKFGVAWVIYRIQMQTQINPLGFKNRTQKSNCRVKDGGGKGAWYPWVAMISAIQKNPWIADRKRSTKSPIATILIIALQKEFNIFHKTVSTRWSVNYKVYRLVLFAWKVTWNYACSSLKGYEHGIKR